MEKDDGCTYRIAAAYCPILLQHAELRARGIFMTHTRGVDIRLDVGWDGKKYK